MTETDKGMGDGATQQSSHYYFQVLPKIRFFKMAFEF